MTKEEIRTRISSIMGEAIKIDNVELIVKDMERTMHEDLSPMSREALTIGYAELFYKACKDIKYIWLHLYDLRKDIEGEPTEEEMEKVREVIGDD